MIFDTKILFLRKSLSVLAECSSYITDVDALSNVQNILFRAVFPEWWEFRCSLQIGKMALESET